MAIVMGVGSGVFGLLILACVARARPSPMSPRVFSPAFSLHSQTASKGP